MMAEHLIIFDNANDNVGFMSLPNCHLNKKRKHELDKISLQTSPKRIHKNDYFE
jgi:hypothetical protein